MVSARPKREKVQHRVLPFARAKQPALAQPCTKDVGRVLEPLRRIPFALGDATQPGEGGAQRESRQAHQLHKPAPSRRRPERDGTLLASSAKPKTIQAPTEKRRRRGPLAKREKFSSPHSRRSSKSWAPFSQPSGEWTEHDGTAIPSMFGQLKQ